jgi:hypothetical protein
LIGPTVFLNHLNGFLPTFHLVRVQLPQMQYSSLNDPMAVNSDAFRQGIINVGFPIFESPVGFQVHGGIMESALSSEKAVGLPTGTLDAIILLFPNNSPWVSLIFPLPFNLVRKSG